MPRVTAIRPARTPGWRSALRLGSSLRRRSRRSRRLSLRRRSRRARRLRCSLRRRRRRSPHHRRSSLWRRRGWSPHHGWRGLRRRGRSPHHRRCSLRRRSPHDRRCSLRRRGRTLHLRRRTLRLDPLRLLTLGRQLRLRARFERANARRSRSWRLGHGRRYWTRRFGGYWGTRRLTRRERLTGVEPADQRRLAWTRTHRLGRQHRRGRPDRGEAAAARGGLRPEAADGCRQARAAFPAWWRAVTEVPEWAAAGG